MPKPSIFISYAHHDREEVRDIFRALKSLNLPVWSDQQIRAGSAWASEIEDALSNAKVIVLCLSPSFLASDWANLEIGVALSRSRESGVKVVPVVLRDALVPESLKRFQYLDARRLSADDVAKQISAIAMNETKKGT